MADRINIADKETLDLALSRVTSAVSDLQNILSKLGASNDTSTNTLFGLVKLASTAAGSSIVKKVLYGNTYMSVINNDSTTHSLIINHESVNVGKSVILFNMSHAGANGPSCRMISRSNTSFTIYATNPLAITWQIIEFN